MWIDLRIHCRAQHPASRAAVGNQAPAGASAPVDKVGRARKPICNFILFWTKERTRIVPTSKYFVIKYYNPFQILIFSNTIII